MRKYFLFVGVISFIVLSGCEQQNLTNETSVTSQTSSSSQVLTENQLEAASIKDAEITTIRNFTERAPLEKHYQFIQYLGREHNPNNDEIMQKYNADGDTYLLRTEPLEVGSFMIKNINEVLPVGSKTYTKAELEKIARDLIYGQTQIDIDQLTANHGSKSDNYFFRWDQEKKSQKNGLYPFIQVGIQKDGLIFSFENTLEY